jgi:hypothetical protein
MPSLKNLVDSIFMGKFPFGHKKTYTSLLATQKIKRPFWPSILFCIPFWPLPLVLWLTVSNMRRNDQYAPSFKFILNIYTWLHRSKKQKVGLNFFCGRRGWADNYFFFANCATYKNYHGHNLRTANKSNGYTI